MPKLNLAQQINETKYRQDENPFDELLQNRGEQTSSKLKVVMLPIAQLEEYKDEAFKRLTGREQPFHCYTPEELISLSESIEKQGVIDPITVRPLPGGNYQIIAGRNRVCACKLIGLATIPGIVCTDIDDTLQPKPILSCLKNYSTEKTSLPSTKISMTEIKRLPYIPRRLRSARRAVYQDCPRLDRLHQYDGDSADHHGYRQQSGGSRATR